MQRISVSTRLSSLRRQGIVRGIHVPQSSVGKEVAMAARASVERRLARPDAQEETLASQSATRTSTPQQQEERLARREPQTQEKQRERRPAGDAGHMTGTTVLVAGGALLAAALFAAGFLRVPIEQALRRLVDRIEVVQLPLVLPITIAETVQELRANSRVMSEIRAEKHGK
jgi:hypothetical protein